MKAGVLGVTWLRCGQRQKVQGERADYGSSWEGRQSRETTEEGRVVDETSGMDQGSRETQTSGESIPSIHEKWDRLRDDTQVSAWGQAPQAGFCAKRRGCNSRGVRQVSQPPQGLGDSTAWTGTTAFKWAGT